MEETSDVDYWEAMGAVSVSQEQGSRAASAEQQIEFLAMLGIDQAVRQPLAVVRHRGVCFTFWDTTILF